VVLLFLGLFLRGSAKKWAFGGGFSVVGTWWNAWYLWSLKHRFAGPEKYATDSNYFLQRLDDP
jgi:hypothetical protein